MTTLPNHRIGVIAGDGIGPELVDSAATVMTAACRDLCALEFVPEDGGAATYRRTGQNLATGALERIRTEYAATLKGPVGLPDVRTPEGTEGGLLGGTLRNGLDAYANVRPIRTFAGSHVIAPTPVDLVVVRENTEGLYLSRSRGVGNDRAVSDQLLMTRHGIERIVHFAFRMSRSRAGAPFDGRRRVTCVDKSNVLRSYAFFRQIFDEIAAQYPDVEADYRYADAAGHDLVFAPDRFDVLVMENFLGDILSDVAAATVGGLGMCPSGNIGDHNAYFEPVHGSAPTIAGKGLANPVSQILSGAMLLRHIGERVAADRIERAVAQAFEEGALQILPSGSPMDGTSAATEAIASRIRRD